MLLLDEPLGALDKKLREHTQFEIMNIQEKTGITFVVVTHDQEEAMTLATRIAVMDKGVIRQTGTPTDIYEFPKTRFVADFIGSINQFDGTVKSRQQRTRRPSPVPTGAANLMVDRDDAIASGRQGRRGRAPGENRDRAQEARPRASMRSKARSSISAISARIRSTASSFPPATLVRVNRVNERRGGESERVAVWEDEVWLSFEPSAAILLTD